MADRWIQGPGATGRCRTLPVFLWDEMFVCRERGLLVWRDGQAPALEVLFWRTTTDREVDFVIESDERLLAIEVKATERPLHRDTTGLRLALCDPPASRKGLGIASSG